MEKISPRVSISRWLVPGWLIVAGVCLSFGGRAAHAANDDAKTAAKAKLTDGARLMDAGDYVQALSDFEEAYKLVQNPKILFNIGLANVGLARYPEAIRAFEQFMAEATNVSSTVISDAQKQIDSLRPKVASIEISASQPGIQIIIDGRPQGKTPLTVRVYVDPGEHRLLAQKDERAPPSVQVFKVVGGEHQTLRVVLPEALAVGPSAASAAGASSGTAAPNLIATPQRETDDQRPMYKKMWFWGVIGAGVVAASVTAFLVVGRSPEYPSASLGSTKVP